MTSRTWFVASVLMAFATTYFPGCEFSEEPDAEPQIVVQFPDENLGFLPPLVRRHRDFDRFADPDRSYSSRGIASRSVVSSRLRATPGVRRMKPSDSSFSTIL